MNEFLEPGCSISIVLPLRRTLVRHSLERPESFRNTYTVEY
jgi:hypothetical protein